MHTGKLRQYDVRIYIQHVLIRLIQRTFQLG